ncbi:hypothetical protein BJX68DRAFT_263380 [Aspergillus pseudodeflectus]|uniref:Uncharacterized protein n=1 Tax=Aspergillus pseudodeflectus TaxID=176178 RepID=A0ABR4KX47_9EURO
MSFTQDSYDDWGQGAEARFRWEQHLLGIHNGFEDPDLHSDHDAHDDTAASENEDVEKDHHDDSQEPEEYPYEDTTPLDDPKPSDMDDDTHIEIQRTHEPALTFAFKPNHHGELYRTYRSTSTFITVDVCIWVEPFSDIYVFCGATIDDLTAQVPAPVVGNFVRGFRVRRPDDLLMVGWGRVVAVVYDQEIYLTGFALE